MQSPRAERLIGEITRIFSFQVSTGSHRWAVKAREGTGLQLAWRGERLATHFIAH